MIEERLKMQKDVENKEHTQKLIKSAIKQEEIEDNLRKIAMEKERNRLKILYEMKEKDKLVNLVKTQKMKILEERKKLNKAFEEKRESLIKRFNLIMSKRDNKSKGEIINALFNNSNHRGIVKRNNHKNLIRNNRSANIANTNSTNQREDIFLTNLSISKIKENNTIF